MSATTDTTTPSAALPTPHPKDLYAVILAGGRGTRFWPLSRRHRPKQCLALASERTMLQETVDRLHPIVSPSQIIVVTGPDMAPLIREQLPGLPSENIVVEPSPRNTAPCIALGAAEVARRGGDEALMAVLPADHHIGDPEQLRALLLAAREAARSTGAIVTLGIRPRYAETGFGYLQLGKEAGSWGGRALHEVAKFTEKPSRSVAEAWLAAGTHLWNAGMFVFSIPTIRAAIQTHLPNTGAAMERITARPEALPEVWGHMDATSIDYGIMERCEHILTIPCDPGWSDLGAWTALDSVLPAAEGGRGHGDPIVAVESEGCTVFAPGKAVALVGVANLVVVDTQDALLVMSKDRAQELRQVLTRLDNEARHLT